MKYIELGISAVLALNAATVQADDSGSYAPYNVTCPSGSGTTLARKANSVSTNESDWLTGRDAVTKPILIDWLNDSNLTDFDASTFLSNQTIRIGTAFSGGGYRAMLSGAGMLAALDNRTDGSTESGHLGGLLQASTYLAGLSGGNWLVSSLVVNNWTSVQTLQNSDVVWDLSDSILSPSSWNILSDASYWKSIYNDIKAKKEAGYNTSITDIWGRALSYQFFNFSDGADLIRYHYVREYDAFKNYEMPFPIHVADGRQAGTTILNLNSTVFEFNPFELGSWDPSVYSFTDLEYLGTEVSNGKSTSSVCVNGYDNVGFLVGTSSSLFNQFILQLNSTGVSGLVYKLAESLLESIGEDNDDIAIYSPNPFKNLSGITNGITGSDYLELVDGGEDGQNVPLVPLYQPEREVDVIFAFDNSADTYSTSELGANWANGTSLVETYQRQFGTQGNGTIFPYIPDQETLIYGGWTQQPGFFGCNRSNLTSLFESDNVTESERNYPPVIIFMANTYYSYYANTSTFKLKYDTDEMAGLIENGYNVVTQGNGTLDENWRSCVACAIILREQQRRGVTPTTQCQECFSTYCWDGSYASNNGSTPMRRDGKSNSEAISALSASSASSSASGTSKKDAAQFMKPSFMVLSSALAAFLILV